MAVVLAYQVLLLYCIYEGLNDLDLHVSVYTFSCDALFKTYQRGSFYPCSESSDLHCSDVIPKMCTDLCTFRLRYCQCRMD
jgi:hypothetical protein